MALGRGANQKLVHGRDLERTVVVFVFPEHLPSDLSIQGKLSREKTAPYAPMVPPRRLGYGLEASGACFWVSRYSTL